MVVSRPGRIRQGEAQRRGEIPVRVPSAQAAEWIARSLFSLSTAPAVTFDARLVLASVPGLVP